MQKTLINGAFKQAYKKVNKLKGRERDIAYAKLNERMEMYSIAKDFADYYPKIYTPEVLQQIVDAKNNVEAENIMTSLRRRQGEYV